MDTAEVVTTLYRFLLGREPDLEGLESHRASLNNGQPLLDVMIGMARSDEFRQNIFNFFRSLE